jgi:ribonucleoside-diphosphate reductase alpha chain
MSVEIKQKIVGYSVVKDAEPVAKSALQVRPEILTGKTYKLKTPLSEHALYVTINDLDKRPFEIFINSKAMEHFQWVVALTRLISAVFRHGGEIGFLVEELRSVFDPKGGYFHQGAYVHSLVAAIGDIVERHLVELGLYARDTSLQQAAVAMIAEKAKVTDGKRVCSKCHERAVITDGGCEICQACGFSRCG